MANTQEKTIKPAGITKLGTDPRKEMEEHKLRIKELEKQLEDQALAEEKAKAEKLKNEAEENAKQTLFNLAKQAGLVLPGIQEKEPEAQTEDSFKVDTFRGIWATAGIFIAFIAVFFIYNSFATLNSSEERISNAAFSHIMSHLPIALVTIGMGFLIMYLLFNQQYRYMVTNINGRYSFQKDFELATTPAIVRMGVALFTFAFPTWIVAYLMLLILG